MFFKKQLSDWQFLVCSFWLFNQRWWRFFNSMEFNLDCNFKPLDTDTNVFCQISFFAIEKSTNFSFWPKRISKDFKASPTTASCSKSITTMSGTYVIYLKLRFHENLTRVLFPFCFSGSCHPTHRHPSCPNALHKDTKRALVIFCPLRVTSKILEFY